MSRTANDNIDYTSKDYRAFKEMMIDKLKEKMPEYTDTSETDAGIVILEALANGLDIISLYSDYIANDLFLPTTQSRKTALMLANTLGYHPYSRSASEYEQVFVLSAEQSTDTIIPKGTVVSVPDTDLQYETQEDLIIPANKLGNEKSGDDYLYHVTIKSGTTISDDIIGSSEGTPSQSFKLSYQEVITDTLKVFVDDVEWERVDSFMGQTALSECFVVSASDDECVITFGNNVLGKIPPVGRSNISATYMVGGGEETNVSANTITQLNDGVPFVEETFNLEVSVKAHNEESLESIKVNAPTHFFTKDRIVTIDDFKNVLLMAFPNDLQDVSAVFSENPTADASRIVQALVISVCVKFAKNRTGNATLEDINSYISSHTIAGIKIGYYNGNTTNVSFPHHYDSSKSDYTLIEGVCESAEIPIEGSTVIKVYLKKGYTRDDSITTKISNMVNEYLYNLPFTEDLVIADLEDYIKSSVKQIRSININCPSGDIIERAITDIDGHYKFESTSILYV